MVIQLYFCQRYSKNKSNADDEATIAPIKYIFSWALVNPELDLKWYRASASVRMITIKIMMRAARAIKRRCLL